ncbi:PREDICTED: procollagen galactosyltransferase 1-like isoform X2 [Amphimedon queenslandica]|uniref:Glycosyl transferase family 25 domain-containing protein n=1 Tax=Amphimedon queenslandica TaxID=400682 RepID=A0AAN0JA54_AMPQE|nr:PREDICTED: procollagen galactosyltransferase 1-like isoform X1 [Amphimedon queenslandica]XP_019853921.1 PREDICTED: procollagen galactosyltransferase 1-like isoform X2 [Amphimedon queenslandica]|eukprot:XP_019853920.1 PREDICTED: procollagen galactosyltransferase 1-like isoform X1 [Amphimedon queenslandica]
MSYMLLAILSLLLLLRGTYNQRTVQDDMKQSSLQQESRPLVYLAILSRNAAHLLPQYLGYIEGLNYPKDKIIIGLYIGQSVDNTTNLLLEWSENVRSIYNNVLIYEDGDIFPLGDSELFSWSDSRLEYMCKLRQDVLSNARMARAEYLFFVDCDNFLINPDVLIRLIEAKKPIVAPLLIYDKERAFSNFWGGQKENGYYLRTEEYLPIVTRSNLGCFKVPLVHSTLLIDLRTVSSESLAYWPPPTEYKWNIDDIILLSYSARVNGIGMYILNTDVFGYLLKTGEYASLEHAIRETDNWKLKTIVNHYPVPVSQFISIHSEKEKAGTDAIYMISLERRTERRQRMLACLDVLQFDYTLFNAVDGKKLNQSYLDELGIHFMPGWKDPWGERPMTFGEVGCFLSHYFIWLRIIAEDMRTVLILEDDIDFQPNFKSNLKRTLQEVNSHDPDWDLVYVGRKKLSPNVETIIPGTKNLVIPRYSYWTLGYIISNRGAEKLIAGKPFDNILPVDEYIPIMYNDHPESDWVHYYENTTRDLRVYSAYPLLVYPTHFAGDKGWYSDTEPLIEVLQEIRKRKLKEEEEVAAKEEREKENEKTEL